MAKDSKRDVVLLFIGEQHGDPAPWVQMLGLLNLCKDRGLKVAVCGEYLPPHNDWDDQIKLLDVKQDLYSYIAAHKGLVDFFVDSDAKFKRRHIKPDRTDEMLEAIKQNQVFSSEDLEDPEFIKILTRLLVQHLCLEEMKSLYRYIGDNNIPTFFIDDDKAFARLDHIARDVTMAREVKNAILSNPEVSVMVCLVGCAHTVNVLAFIEKSFINHPNVNLKTIPAIVCSDYYGDDLRDWFGKFSKQLKDTDLAKSTYNTLSNSFYRSVENEDGTFKCAELNSTLIGVLDRLKQSQSMTCYVVGTLTKEQSEFVIKELGGEILQEIGKVYVKVNSKDLKKENRDKLGLIRKKTNLSDNQRRFLEERLDVTVEQSEESGKYLITFPTDRLHTVTEVVDLPERMGLETGGFSALAL